MSEKSFPSKIIWTTKTAEAKVGTLSKPSKMPGHAYSTPAEDCITGSKLAKVKNSICSFCYARKGRYVFPNVKKAMKKRLDSLKRSDWIDAMSFLINKKEKSGYFRWHDSGDVQGVWHLSKIAAVAKNLPHIKFWLPTREYSFATSWAQTEKKPDNLNVRLSAFMKNGPAPTRLARQYGFTTSGVSSSGVFTCPAPNQANQCGDCRACWDVEVDNVDYKKH